MVRCLLRFWRWFVCNHRNTQYEKTKDKPAQTLKQALRGVAQCAKKKNLQAIGKGAWLKKAIGKEQ